MWYNITKTSNFIEIKNLDDSSIKLEVTFTTNCNDESVEEFTIFPINLNLVNVSTPFSYEMLKDGKYTFKLIKDEGLGTEEIKYFIVPFYDSFLKNIISTLEDLFCGCSDCKDCIDYDVLLKSYHKVLAYYTLTKRYYSAYVDIILSCSECEIMTEIACMISNEKYLGEHNSITFLKKLIGYYYFSFYFAELREDNETEIKLKFKYDSIIRCIKGIDIDCITQKVEQMARVEITNGAYTNQPPTTVGSYSTSLTNREDITFTSAMFTTQTTPAYSDPEGDAADAIRIDSLPATGILEYDNTPVTVGQIITIGDIDLGLLVFKAPNQNEAVSSTFNFSIRDSGSLTFVSS